MFELLRVLIIKLNISMEKHHKNALAKYNIYILFIY